MLALICSIVAVGASGSSAAVGVSPLSATIAPGATAAAFAITNPENVDRVVQPEVSRWEHVDGKDHLTKTTDWIVNPPIVTVPPLSSRVIRMALKRRVSLTEEVNYRLVISDVRSRVESADRMNVAVATHVSLPLFVEPATASRKQPEWSAARNGAHEVIVTLKNYSPIHVHVTQFILRSPAGKTVETSAPSYVFSGETRTWTLVVDPSAPDIASLVVEAYTDTPVRTISITGR